MSDIVAEVLNFSIYEYYLSKIAVLWSCILRKQYTYLYQSKYIAICSIDVLVDDFDRFVLFFFYFENDNLPSRKFFFFLCHENSHLLFHPRFSLILFIFLVFKLIVILFGVKAWYFYYGKCSLAVWLCQIL